MRIFSNFLREEMNQLIELQEVHIHSSWVEVYLIGHKILVDG